MSVLSALGSSDRAAVRARSRRRAFPIHFYSGRNGSGKSFYAVWDSLPDLDAGLPVLSTVRLLDFRNPRACDDDKCGCDKENERRHRAAHPAYTKFTKWTQLLEWTAAGTSTCVIIMDEITGVADSNEAGAMPSAVGNRLAQLRRGDVAVRITGLNFIRCSKRIREAANAVSVCKGSWPITVQDEEGKDKLWRQRRLSVVRSYDAESLPLDDITPAAYEKADRVGGGRLWIPGNLAILAYDSLDAVAVVGSVTDSGRCAHCAGTRRAQECTCPDYLAEKASRKAAGSQDRLRAENRSSAGSARLVSARGYR